MPPEMDRQTTSRVFLGLGGNLGNPLENFIAARLMLSEHPGIELNASSPLYRTPAVGGPAGQPDYQNAVIEITTELNPQQLLACCQDVEELFGRTRDLRWGPRTLDIDLLLFDQSISDEPQLILPHPRLHERHFALLPLADLHPDLLHPRLRKTVSELLRGLPAAPGIRIISAQW